MQEALEVLSSPVYLPDTKLSFLVGKFDEKGVESGDKLPTVNQK